MLDTPIEIRNFWVGRFNGCFYCPNNLYNNLLERDNTSIYRDNADCIKDTRTIGPLVVGIRKSCIIL